jgi:acetyl esterase/lipase
MAVICIAILGPFVQDAEAAVARRIPRRLSHFLRDRWESWAVFNGWTWALVAPVLALTRFDLLRQFMDTQCQHLDVPYMKNAPSMDDEQDFPTASSALPSAGRRTLDIYHHTDTSGPARPVVVFVHGGAWAHGSKVRDLNMRASAVSRVLSTPWAHTRALHVQLDHCDSSRNTRLFVLHNLARSPT